MLLKRFNFISAVRFRWLLAACTACALVAAAAQAQTDPVQLQGNLDQAHSVRRPLQSAAQAITPVPEDLGSAVLEPGYLLQLEVYDNPDLSGTVRVDPKGNLNVPLVGTVSVQGKTVPEAEEAIARAMIDRQILIAPQVSLNILQFSSGSVTVLGEVQSPGRVQLLQPKPLSQVLALAGGQTQTAGNTVSIQHRGADGRTSERLVTLLIGRDAGGADTLVYPGDTVVMHRAAAVYVLGAVTRPGAYLMVDNGSLNLLQALSLAQGTQLRASVGHAEILRATGEGYTRLWVPLAKMQKGKENPTPLLADDIVYIPTSGVKTFFLDASALVSSAATATVYSVAR